MKGRSCETQLFDTYHRLANGVDIGNQSDIVFLDFSKAFVSHVHLIYKLRKFVISGSLLQRFVSYLDGRLQRVTIGKLLNGVQLPLVFHKILYLDSCDLSCSLTICPMLFRTPAPLPSSLRMARVSPYNTYIPTGSSDSR